MEILFLGGDKRMAYAADFLSAYGYEIRRGEDAGGSRFPVIVLPVPLTKNGEDVFSPLSSAPLPLEQVAEYAEPNALILAGGECPRLREVCAEHTLVNYFAEESLTLRNAALTAEAAVARLVQSSDCALLGSRALIVGYGRIARELAARLSAFGCECVIAARRLEARTEAELRGFRSVSAEELPSLVSEFPFIVNTAPAPLFSEDDFSCMREDCVFLELASLPPREERRVRYIHAAGLPGKFSPKTAGRFIAEELLRFLR
ncbi:MAG: dipicolinate synthase subunit DpsA [Oscillospiraceae bacterium]